MVRDGAEPGASRQDDRRLVRRERGGARRRPLRPRPRAPTRAARSGCRRRAAGSSASSRAGDASRPRACSRSARRFDTVGPMARTVEEVALAWSVLAGTPVPEPRLRGLTVGLLTRPPSVGGAALPENRAAEQYVERLEQLGARVVPAEHPGAVRRHVAALLPRGRGVAPRDVPRAGRRLRRERARQARARADARSRRGRHAHATPSAAGASTARRSISTSRRCSASSCRRSTATSSRCGSR